MTINHPHKSTASQVFSNIRALLVARQITRKEIMYKYRIDRSSLSLVLRGKRKTRRIREAIAAELQVPYDEIWRERTSPPPELTKSRIPEEIASGETGSEKAPGN